MTVLSIENLVVSKKCLKTRKDINILKAVSATFESGKVNAIMGPNGCGKSTLLSAIFGLCDSNTNMAGKITLDGQERDFYSWIDCISYLEQSGYLIPDQIVSSCFDFILNVICAQRNVNSSISQYSAILDALQISQDLLCKKVSELSGGERHRVHIALELIMNKKIIMLDEPTSDLDSYLAANLMMFLNEYARNNDTIMIVTIHQPSKCIYEQFDNFLFMKDGRVIYNGPAIEAEGYLGKLGITKPKDSVFTEFLFDAFYDNSKRVETTIKDAIVSLTTKIEQDTDLIIDATARKSNGSYLHLMRKINLKTAYIIFKRIAEDYFSLRWISLLFNQLMFMIFVAIGLLLSFVSVSSKFIQSGGLRDDESDNDLIRIFKRIFTLDEKRISIFTELRLEIILSCLVVFYSMYGMIKKDRDLEFKQYICKGVVTKLELLAGYYFFVFVYSTVYIFLFTLAADALLTYFYSIPSFCYLFGDTLKIATFCALSASSYVLIESICEIILKKSNYLGALHFALFLISSSLYGSMVDDCLSMLKSLLSLVLRVGIGAKIKNAVAWTVFYILSNLFSSTYFRYTLVSYIVEKSYQSFSLQEVDFELGSFREADSIYGLLLPDYTLYKECIVDKVVLLDNYRYKDTFTFATLLITSIISSTALLYAVFGKKFYTRYNLLNTKQ